MPFKDLETAAGTRLSFQALKVALNALVAEKAVARISEKPARLRITATGRTQLDSYRS
ncbi:hypothetical protein [Methylobacterium durans]|uniref:hypothetical protein n=1 Tax=Methylobacterium durans TaxID=2202825 RepID=UPI0013A58C0A|nr:hypothetical protein [Methylobacterium durans]